MSEPSDEGISVVIANWNGGDHILRCLDSLEAQTRAPNEIILVDNGSRDDSPFQIRKRFPHVRLLTRPVNEGFCTGYNRAIRASRRPYLLILNSDITLDPDYLDTAVRAIQKDPRIGWVSGTIHHDRPGVPDFHGRFLTRHVSLLNGEAGHDGDVFAGSGASIFCRRSMLDDVAHDGEYYDELFFAYIEDLDLAWRVQLRGWRCTHVSELRCRHVGSASQDGRMRVHEKSAFFLTHIIKNRYLALLKNATPGILFRFAPSLLVGELLLWLNIGLRAPDKLATIPRAVRMAVPLIPAAIRRRNVIMRRRLVSDRHILDMTRGL